MSEIVFICGRRGSGKTTRAKKEIRNVSRLIVWDPMGEYGRSDSPALTIEDLDSFMDYPFETLDQFRVSYRPLDDKTEAPWFLRLCYALTNYTLVLEETDTICNPYFAPREFRAVIRRGRHRGISVIGVSRAPREVSRDITAQAHRLIIYGMHEPRDLDYFRSFGIDADQLPLLEQWQALEHSFIEKGIKDALDREPLRGRRPSESGRNDDSQDLD